tara:strand:+ start:2712 stop:4766 length:2055 start_codon:yes stop_codon:yes gene_type:complete
MAQNNRNPKNNQSELFKRLTRLFSGPIVNYRQQNVRKDRRKRLDKYANTFRTASGQDFKKKSYNPYDTLMSDVIKNVSRSERYADFDQMEYTPELATSLDIYADEITYHDGFQRLLKINCVNQEIKEILHSLYYDVLNIEFNLFGYARSMCKYGDFYLYMDIDDDLGIKSVIGLPPQEVERLEGEDKTNPNYIQYQWNSGGLTFENWQIAHFRILGNDKFSPYGTSVLDPARRIWRQLTMMEDAMMAYRIVRAPDRRAFYVDVGGVPPEDVEQFMQKVMTQMKRHQVVDSSTGRVDLRYNPASIEEDYYIPVRGGTSGTKIENVGGQARTNDIEDVKYLRDKMLSSIKVPPSYVVRDSAAGGTEDKSTLAQKDIRFARTIQRIQRSLVSELEKLGIVHLYTLGYRGEDLLSFTLNLTNPSKIAQLQEMENMRVKFEIANSAVQSIFSTRWVSENVFGISEEEYVRNQREKFYDKKVEAASAKIAQATVETGAEAGAFGGGFGLGGGLEGLGGEAEAGLEATPELGAEPTPAPEAAATPAPEAAPEPAPAAGGEEGGLLVTPGDEAAGKRDDDAYKKPYKVTVATLDGEKTTTSRSKGKYYKPVTTDKRDMGARRKNYLSKSGVEQGGVRKSHKGYHELKNIGKGIMQESNSNYNDEIERSVLMATDEINKLIGSLEKKKDETKS